MIEVFGDFWEHEADAHVITTNGTIKESGAAVMGRGVARQAKMRFPGIPMYLGSLLQERGNRVHYLGEWTRADGRSYNLFSFPVKHNWDEPADLELIAKSAAELAVEASGYHTVAIVRPGCGNGGRDWITEVRAIVKPFLGTRFHVVQKR